MSTKEDIRYALNSLLAESGKKNSELAEHLGVSRAAVSNWTKGQNSIDMELIPGICNFFSVSIDEFFGRSAPKRISSDEEQLLAFYRGMTEQGRVSLMASAEGLYQAFRVKNNQVSRIA